MLLGKTAIVTGASRGIGRQITIALAQAGADVVVQGRSEDTLKNLQEAVVQMGRTAAIVIGDVTEVQTAAETVRVAEQIRGPIDILVNNAGMNSRSSTLDMALEDWHRVIDVNLNGTLHFCRATLPKMIAQKYGSIVNVSSTTSKTPHRNAAPSYGASKAAVNYLTMHLAQEMAQYNIRVNAVCPGPVESDMTAEWSEEYRQATLARIPLGRLGTPQSIAEIVLFLASDMSNFVTGETINANGGTYMN